MTHRRASGLLLHITSLPGPYGIGDLGPEAFRFVDFLAGAGQSLWQVLPVVPVGYGYSPYASPSTFAGNPYFISPDRLIERGWLERCDIGVLPDFPDDIVDFTSALALKDRLLRQAFAGFESRAAAEDREAFSAFCDRHKFWLDDYALYEVLKSNHQDKEWMAWEKPFALREPEAIENARRVHADAIEMHRFWQFVFEQQWQELKAYCHANGVRIFGDLPIYVAQDSADVWAHPELFHLDESGVPVVVAGVPPDYFSETGQRWGNPIYRWESMKETGFSWWVNRFSRILELVDLVRLDHFRGFEAYWEVPGTEETAMHGQWVEGPGADLFETLQSRLGELPVIAENLGVITDGVTHLMERFGFPGMAILQFAFDTDADNEFLPHNYGSDLVAYTGTHDNDTFMGWWSNTQSTQDAEVIRKAHQYCEAYLGVSGRGSEELSWAAIRVLMASVATLVVSPVQDVLGLGTNARMNTPGTVGGNWSWRLAPDLLGAQHGERLKEMVEIYGRL